MGVPAKGQIPVTLACVRNVNPVFTRRVYRTINVSHTHHVGSLSSTRILRVHRCVSTGLAIRNSLHHRARVGVGHVVSLNSCHNLHRHHNLPIHNRHARAGTHAHGNPTGPVTNGGGWKIEAVTHSGAHVGHGRHGGVTANITRIGDSFGGAGVLVSSIRNGTVT